MCSLSVLALFDIDIWHCLSTPRDAQIQNFPCVKFSTQLYATILFYYSSKLHSYSKGLYWYLPVMLIEISQSRLHEKLWINILQPKALDLLPFDLPFSAGLQVDTSVCLTHIWEGCLPCLILFWDRLFWMRILCNDGSTLKHVTKASFHIPAIQNSWSLCHVSFSATYFISSYSIK
jgi:hypothetical protein